MNQIRYQAVTVLGLDIFYREAGPQDAPTILLLHGFPTSSHMFRNLIPALADQFHLVAPDYPGFGNSSMPNVHEFEYTFDNFTDVVDRFTQALGLARYTLCVQDYGAPIGFRLALRHPEKVEGLVIQNGNAYEEGLSPVWDPIKAYWREPTLANRETLRAWFNPEGIRLQYVAGVPEERIPLISPDTWMLDWALLSRPGNIDLQLNLFGDYQTNVARYPLFHAFFRECRPPTLIVWGKQDPFFIVAGAEAYKRDLQDVELHLLDTGHFALETHGDEIARRIRQFMQNHMPLKQRIPLAQELQALKDSLG